MIRVGLGDCLGMQLLGKEGKILSAMPSALVSGIYSFHVSSPPLLLSKKSEVVY